MSTGVKITCNGCGKLLGLYTLDQLKNKEEQLALGCHHQTRAIDAIGGPYNEMDFCPRCWARMIKALENDGTDWRECPYCHTVFTEIGGSNV